MSESHTHDSSATSFALLSVLPSCSYTFRDVLVTLRDDDPELHIQEATASNTQHTGSTNNNATTPWSLCRGPHCIGSNRLVVLCDMQALDPHMVRDEYLATALDVVQIMQRDYQAKFVLVDSSHNNNTGVTDNHDNNNNNTREDNEQPMFGLELTPQLAQEFVAHLLQAKQPMLLLPSANSSVVTQATTEHANNLSRVTHVHGTHAHVFGRCQ